ncbi:MAG: hypothetical protein QXU11_11955 [Thermoproteota archaeon]
MLDLLIVFGIAVYVAWSMGANNESMSILAGSGFMSTTMAAILGAAGRLRGVAEEEEEKAKENYDIFNTLKKERGKTSN